jgi:prolyl oligopeptidase PreP (S9A serine peptidase family)
MIAQATKAESAAIESAAVDLAGLEFSALFTPSPSSSLRGYTTTRTRVLISVLDHVAGRLEEWQLADDGAWIRRPVDAPFPGVPSVLTPCTTV